MRTNNNPDNIIIINDTMKFIKANVLKNLVKFCFLRLTTKLRIILGTANNIMESNGASNEYLDSHGASPIISKKESPMIISISIFKDEFIINKSSVFLLLLFIFL